MKTSNPFDATEKARIYHTLAQMISSFSSIVRYCEDLQQAGVLAPRYKRLFQAFALEVQAELNHQILEAVDKIELADWGRFGRVRERWEKYLKGERKKASLTLFKRSWRCWTCPMDVKSLRSSRSVESRWLMKLRRSHCYTDWLAATHHPFCHGARHRK